MELTTTMSRKFDDNESDGLVVVRDNIEHHHAARMGVEPSSTRYVSNTTETEVSYQSISSSVSSSSSSSCVQYQNIKKIIIIVQVSPKKVA